MREQKPREKQLVLRTKTQKVIELRCQSGSFRCLSPSSYPLYKTRFSWAMVYLGHKVVQYC